MIKPVKFIQSNQSANVTLGTSPKSSSRVFLKFSGRC